MAKNACKDLSPYDIVGFRHGREEALKNAFLERAEVDDVVDGRATVGDLVAATFEEMKTGISSIKADLLGSAACKEQQLLDYVNGFAAGFMENAETQVEKERLRRSRDYGNARRGRR